MSDLTDRLRVQPTASHFLKPAHLYQSLIEERSEAADLIDQQALAIRELVEALEPFSEAVENTDGNDDYSAASIWEHPCAVDITIGHLRRARAAIAKALP